MTLLQSKTLWSQQSKSDASCKCFMKTKSVWPLWLHPGICTKSTWDQRCNISSMLRWTGMPGQQVVNAVTSRTASTQSVKCIWTGFRADLVSGSASFMFSVQQENVKHISWCQPFHLNKVQRSHQGIEMEPTKGTVSWPKLKQTSGNNNRPYPWGTGREPKPQQTHLGIWRQNPATCSKQRWCLHSFIKLSWITAN